MLLKHWDSVLVFSIGTTQTAKLKNEHSHHSTLEIICFTLKKWCLKVVAYFIWSGFICLTYLHNTLPGPMCSIMKTFIKEHKVKLLARILFLMFHPLIIQELSFMSKFSHLKRMNVTLCRVRAAWWSVTLISEVVCNSLRNSLIQTEKESSSSSNCWCLATTDWRKLILGRERCSS